MYLHMCMLTHAHAALVIYFQKSQILLVAIQTKIIIVFVPTEELLLAHNKWNALINSALLKYFRKCGCIWLIYFNAYCSFKTQSELAEPCSFWIDKEEQIKDAFAIDIADKEMSLKLQMDSELTLKKAIQIDHHQVLIKKQNTE